MVGLGVGASCTVFSARNALLIRPLPFTDPDRLVWIANGTSDKLSAQTTQVANFVELQAQSVSFSGIGGYSPFYGAGDILLSGGGESERLTGMPVTETFFPVLGLKPGLGRSFSAEECRWKAQKTVVLRHGFWQRRFARDPGVIVRQLILDGEPATIIDVLPAAFDFAATFTPCSRADLFYPFPLTRETNSQGNTLALIGRLRQGANLNTAQAEATVVGERIRSAVALDRWRNGFRPKLSSLRDRRRHRHRRRELSGARKRAGNRSASEKEMTPAASNLGPNSNPALYISAVLALYVDLPDTPLRASVPDQHQARSWFDRAFPSKWSRRRSCWPASVEGRGPSMCRRSHEFVHWPTSNPSLTNSWTILLPAAISPTCASNSVASSTTLARSKSKIYVFR